MLGDLVEDHKLVQDGVTYTDSDATLTRIKDWLGTPAASIVKPSDHVMLLTSYVSSTHSTHECSNPYCLY